MANLFPRHIVGWLGGRWHPTRGVVLIFVLLCTALTAADWSLVLLNGRLDRALKERQRAAQPKPGDVITSLAGVSPSGGVVDVPLNSRPTVLFVFSTTCPICVANWKNWESLARSIDTKQFRVLYANLADSLPASFVAEHYFLPEAQVIGKVDPTNQVDYRLVWSPMILVIDHNSVVRHVWLGYTGPKLQAIRATLGAHLSSAENGS